MPNEISNTMRSSVYSTEMPYVILDAIKLDHETLPEPLYFVNNNEEIEYEGNTYIPVSFKFSLPDEEGSSNNDATLTIGNIERTLMTLIRSITTFPTLEYRMLLIADTITTESGPYFFELRQVKYNAQTVSGTLIYDFRPDRATSTIRVTLLNFPGLQTL